MTENIQRDYKKNQLPEPDIIYGWDIPKEMRKPAPGTLFDLMEKYGLKPMAEIVGIGQGGVEPDVMGLGPVPAVRNALINAGMKLSEIELLELNEAFAAQSLGVVKLLSEEHGESQEAILDRCNVNGGAIALGHPVGASGNRILVTLAHELKRSGKTYGLASLCIGGGMGTSIIVER